MKKKLTVYARAVTDKIKHLLYAGIVITCTQTVYAQKQTTAATKENSICGITAEYSTFVNKRIAEKIKTLRTAGKISSAVNKQSAQLSTPVSFRFPLADNKHRDFASWRMFNYLDVNNSGITDYNCGGRTYDGHTGIDILLEPYYWKEQHEENIWVIAAAPGVIVDKHDGEFDEQCTPPASICTSEPDNRGNYVVILHDDGSTASLYMHMVQNSLTTKQEGDRVYAGDYLGIAGSSGCSSAPHLHFEVRTGYEDDGAGYENTGTIVDPFANGSCATSTDSWWITETPYTDPAVITLETHNADPEGFTEGLDWCDQTVLLYPDNSFSSGQTIWFRSKFRDWVDGSTITHSIYKPDGTLWHSYTRTNPGYNRGFIPSDAGYTVSASDPTGTYRYTVTFGGKTYSHYFSVNCQYSLGMSGSLSGHKGYMVSHSITSSQTISGLSSNYVKFMADTRVTLTPGFRAYAGCRFVANTEGCANSTSGFSKVAAAEVVSNAVVKQPGEINTPDAFKVFPNPSTGAFTVQYSHAGSFTATINIRNMMGQVVHSIPARMYQSRLQEQVNITGKPKGMYTVEIATGDKKIITKILVQ